MSEAESAVVKRTNVMTNIEVDVTIEGGEAEVKAWLDKVVRQIADAALVGSAESRDVETVDRSYTVPPGSGRWMPALVESRFLDGHEVEWACLEADEGYWLTDKGAAYFALRADGPVPDAMERMPLVALELDAIRSPATFEGVEGKDYMVAKENSDIRVATNIHQMVAKAYPDAEWWVGATWQNPHLVVSGGKAVAVVMGLRP